MFSPIYTYIGSVGDSDIEIRVYVPPNRLADIRWSFTNIDTEIRTELAIGAGERAIMVQPLLENAGIYEAYVNNRYERTWGAIIRLIIRRKCQDYLL